MSDLEDVLTCLDKMKTSMKEGIKFIERIEKLFGGWSASLDMGAELSSTSLEELTDWINNVLIKGED